MATTTDPTAPSFYAFTRIRKLFSNLIGLKPIVNHAKPTYGDFTHSTDRRVDYRIIQNGRRTTVEGMVFTSDSPSTIAAKIAEHYPDFCTEGARIWVNDHNETNSFCHRFRFVRDAATGQPIIRFIDPRIR